MFKILLQRGNIHFPYPVQEVIGMNCSKGERDHPVRKSPNASSLALEKAAWGGGSISLHQQRCLSMGLGKSSHNSLRRAETDFVQGGGWGDLYHGWKIRSLVSQSLIFFSVKWGQFIASHAITLNLSKIMRSSDASGAKGGRCINFWGWPAAS